MSVLPRPLHSWFDHRSAKVVLGAVGLSAEVTSFEPVDRWTVALRRE
jgi:hypothetical protein